VAIKKVIVVDPWNHGWTLGNVLVMWALDSDMAVIRSDDAGLMTVHLIPGADSSSEQTEWKIAFPSYVPLGLMSLMPDILDYRWRLKIIHLIRWRRINIAWRGGISFFHGHHQNSASTMPRSSRKSGVTLGKLGAQVHAGGTQIPDNDPIKRGMQIGDPSERHKVGVQVGGVTYSAPSGILHKHPTYKQDVRIIPRSTINPRVFSGSQQYLDIELDKVPVTSIRDVCLRFVLRNSSANPFTLESPMACFDRIEIRPNHADPLVTYYTEELYEEMLLYTKRIRANCEQLGIKYPVEHRLGEAYLPDNKDTIVIGPAVPNPNFSVLGNLTGAYVAPNTALAETTVASTFTTTFRPGQLIIPANSTKEIFMPLDFIFYFHPAVHTPTLCRNNRPVIRFYFASDYKMIGNTYNFSIGRDDASDDLTTLFPAGTAGRNMINALEANLITLDDIEIKIQGTCYNDTSHDAAIAAESARTIIKTCVPQRYQRTLNSITTGTPMTAQVDLSGVTGSTAGLTIYWRKSKDVNKPGAQRHFVAFKDSTWRTSGGKVIDEDRKTSEIHSRIPEKVAFHRTSEWNPYIKGHSSQGQYYWERPDAFSYTTSSGDPSVSGVNVNLGLGSPRALLTSSPFYTGAPDQSPRIYAEFYSADAISDVLDSSESGMIVYDTRFTLSMTFGNDYYDRPMSSVDLDMLVIQRRNMSIYIDNGKVEMIRH